MIRVISKMDSCVGEKGFIFLWLTSILVTRIQMSEKGPWALLVVLTLGMLATQNAFEW